LPIIILQIGGLIISGGGSLEYHHNLHFDSNDIATGYEGQRIKIDDKWKRYFENPKSQSILSKQEDYKIMLLGEQDNIKAIEQYAKENPFYKITLLGEEVNLQSALGNLKDEIISSPDLDRFKKANPFIVKMAQIQEGIKTSPRELREDYPFEFKIWLQEMYEEMMLGIRSPRILGSSTLTQERMNAENFKKKKVIELMFVLKSKLKTCWKLWLENIETREGKLGKKYENMTAKQKQDLPKPGLLTKLYIINEEFPKLFYNKFFEIKQNTILLKISLTLFNSLIRNTNITKTNQKNVHNNTFIKDLKNRLQKTFGKIIEGLEEMMEEDPKLEQIENEKHKSRIINIIKKPLNLEQQSEFSEPSNILNLAYNFLLFLQFEGYLKPKVGDYEDIDLLFEKNKLDGEDFTGSSPNMSILTPKLIPIPTEKEKNIDSDAIIRELTKEKAKIMYCPPKDHIKLRNNKLNEPDFKYYGGNLNKGNQITINSLKEWDYFIKDKNIKLKDHKCELGDLTLLALNKLQQTQWEINLDFLRVVAKFKGENNTKTPIKKLTINSYELGFLPWIKKCMSNLIEQESSKKESYEAKKDNWERILEDASKVIRNTGNVFWHAWTAGPRTRLYARSQNLSPNGDDFSKAMIRFKEWKPINERGFYWLKIHLFNHFQGIGNTYFSHPCPDKKSDLDARVKWIDENKERFQKIAKNPENFEDLLGFTNNIFLKKDVFSRLAILLEYNRIINELEILMNSKELKNYEQMTPSERNEILKNIHTGLPIYLDASNNGFQHMAAFTRNSFLGNKVNISDTETQQDLYQEIVIECNKLFEKSDFQEFLKKKGLTPSEIKKWKDECFSRDFIKTPTMIFSYGGNVLDAIRDKPKKSKSKINKNKSGMGIYQLKWKDRDKEGYYKTKKAIHKKSIFYNLLYKNQELPKVKELFLINEKSSKKPKAIWSVDEEESKKLDDCTELCKHASEIIEDAIIKATDNVKEKIKKTFEKIYHHDCYDNHPLQLHNDWINNSLPNSDSSGVTNYNKINDDDYGISKPYFEWQTIISPNNERFSPTIRNIYPRYRDESFSPLAEFFSIDYEGKRYGIMSFKSGKHINNYYSYTLDSLKIFKQILENKRGPLSKDLELGFVKEIKEFEECPKDCYLKKHVPKEIRKEKEMWLSKQHRNRRDWKNKIIFLIYDLLENETISVKENETIQYLFIEFLSRTNIHLVYPITGKKIKTWIKKELDKIDKIKVKNNLSGQEQCKDLTVKVKKDLKNNEFLYPNPEYTYRDFKTSLIPNIIHSFDATHMQLIITKFINEEENRKDFFAVHDCFGTHACDIDTLNDIFLNSFVELYSDLNIKSFIEQIIYNTNNGFGKIIKGKTREEILDDISLGDLKIESVKDSKFMIN